MNVNEVINSISDKKHRDDLAHWVDEWKKDETDVRELYSTMIKWHGNVYFEDQNNQNKLYENLQKFKITAIDNLNSMTVNERLFFFGLFDEWDRADSNGQERIRNKISAPL